MGGDAHRAGGECVPRNLFLFFLFLPIRGTLQMFHTTLILLDFLSKVSI